MHRKSGMKRSWAVTAAAAAAALALVGCSSGGGSGGSPGGGSAGGTKSLTVPSQDPTATLKVLSILSLKNDNMQPVLDAFAKAHPTIKINWQTVPFDALASTVDSRISKKTGDPDVYWADQPRISALAARGEAADLTSAFAADKDKFDPTAYQAGLFKDKLWALPIANSSQLLYYNKDLLNKAGVPAPSADPTNRITWEQLTADAAKAKKAGARYGLVFGQVDRYYQLEPLPVSKGGSAGGSGGGNLTPDITSQPWVDAFTWYGKLFANGVSPRGTKPETSDSDFLAGKTAFLVQGPWTLPTLQTSKLKYGVAAHPMFQGGKAVTPTGSWSLAVNPFSKSQEAASIFLKFMAIDQGSGYIKYRTSPELAASVAGKQVYFSKPVFKSAEGQKAAKILNYETAHTAVNRLQTVGYIEFEEIMNRAFSDIRNGADAKTTLQKASDELNSAWSKYK